MQPDFAFDPAPPQKILSGPKPAGGRLPRIHRPEKYLSAAARDGETAPSFQSSLREARQRDREAGPAERSESDREPAETRAETGPESRSDECRSRSDVDHHSSDGQTETGGKPLEGKGEASAEKTEKEEDAVDELSGAAAASLVASAPDSVPAETGAACIDEAATGNKIGGPGSPEMADDLKIQPAETDPGPPKMASAGLKDPAPGSETEKAPGPADSGSPAGNALPKGESMNTHVSAGAGDNRVDDPLRSREDLTQPDDGSRKTEKTGSGGQVGAGTAGGRESEPGKLPGEQIRPPQNIHADQKAAAQARSAVESRASSQEDGPAARSGQALAEQKGAARVQGEVQQIREGDARNEPLTGDEAGTKLAKVSPGARDSALMHQQDQNFDRLMESNSATRAKEETAGAWRAQTLDQIVNKAVYHLKNGQNSVHIDLKPEFLGQVRMQIITVDHQVSVRITTDLPAVKEMLDNQLQQLKADLQQQGLEVDEIEVSVSTDAQHNAQNRRMPFEETPPSNGSDGKEVSSDLLPAAGGAAKTRSSNGAVDMFV